MFEETEARFRRRTSHVPNLIDELGTAARRATYESIKYGRIWSCKSSTQVRQSLSHYATLERH
jgi:hypothetical protein